MKLNQTAEAIPTVTEPTAVATEDKDKKPAKKPSKGGGKSNNAKKSPKTNSTVAVERTAVSGVNETGVKELQEPKSAGSHKSDTNLAKTKSSAAGKKDPEVATLEKNGDEPAKPQPLEAGKNGKEDTKPQ